MGHSSVTLLRAAPGRPWVRIEGFVTPSELVRLYRQQLQSAQTVSTR
jgi:protein SCO1/2